MPPLFVLFAWPVAVIVFFQKLKTPLALLISVLAGYLLLPGQTGYDLPVLPSLNKDTVPIFAALVMSAIVVSNRGPDTCRPGWIPQSLLVRFLLLLLIFGAFMTALTNSEILFYGPRWIFGLKSYDAFSIVLNASALFMPFILARKFLADPQGHRTFLLVLCGAGLLYSLFALYEVRMSPQLNLMFYGFFPHSWNQHIRGDGFRPIVFLQHGLWVSIFFAGTVLAALGVFRTRDTSRRWLFLGAAAWLLLTLALTKSLGALVITLCMIPLVLFLGVRTHLMVAAAIAVLVLTYPMARSVGLVPVDKVLAIAESIDPWRASSLQFRLDNERVLLEKARERILFGWGGYGRARVYDDWGRDITVLDGHWVITMGSGGWFRYLAEFGLLAAPLILLAARRRRYDIGPETSVLALILAGNLLDLLPNGTITPLTWMLVGALWGRLELQNAGAATSAETQTPANTRRRLRYNSDKKHTENKEELMGTTPAENKENTYTRQHNRVYRRKSRTVDTDDAV